MREIDRYEHELEALIKSDKSTWTRFVVLMEEIEEKRLYKDLGLNSFTAWVKDFANKHKIHESVLWNRKKAGKVYRNLEEYQKQKGNIIPPLEHANIGVDSLVLLDKITNKDSDMGAELAEKALKGELTRDNLRTAYKTIRDRNNNQSKQDKNTPTEKDNVESNDTDSIINENVTAAKIVQSLNNSQWLGVAKRKRHFRGAYEQDKYKTLTEFPVYTGTSKKSRRIDVLVAENLRCDNHYSLNLHAVEIKVSKSDFLNDRKYTEYAEFVNFLWIAIPKDLVNIVEEHTPLAVGILVFDNEKILIHREAELLKPLMIKDALTTLSLRLI